MRSKSGKWILRASMTGLLIFGILMIIVLNPILSYAHKTRHNNFVIYYNHSVDSSVFARLDYAEVILRSSEFYRTGLQLDICLNDGAWYPRLIEIIHGKAFASGFYNKVVIHGLVKAGQDYVELNGYKWNMSSLLAHEMTHCLQFDRLGIWRSNPVAGIPEWKWEGYAEYIARTDHSVGGLSSELTRIVRETGNSWSYSLPGGTIIPRNYHRFWMMMRFCMDVKRMSYMQVLADSTDEASMSKQMMTWYEGLR